MFRAPLDIRVSVDVGCKSHQVAVGLSTGEVIDEFSICHQPDGFSGPLGQDNNPSSLRW